MFNVPLELKSKDIPILGGAVALQFNHLLTGDKKDFACFSQVASRRNGSLSMDTDKLKRN